MLNFDNEINSLYFYFDDGNKSQMFDSSSLWHQRDKKMKNLN